MGRPQPRWHLGGGTILAQRWAHRESTDIDLTVPAGSRILELDKRFGGTLEADMYGLGARDVLMGATSTASSSTKASWTSPSWTAAPRPATGGS